MLYIFPMICQSLFCLLQFCFVHSVPKSDLASNSMQSRLYGFSTFKVCIQIPTFQLMLIIDKKYNILYACGAHGY